MLVPNGVRYRGVPLYIHIIIGSPRNVSKMGFLKFHPRAYVSSFRNPSWLHYWHFYHNDVTKAFPEILIDIGALKTRLV